MNYPEHYRSMLRGLRQALWNGETTPQKILSLLHQIDSVLPRPVALVIVDMQHDFAHSNGALPVLYAAEVTRRINLYMDLLSRYPEVSIATTRDWHPEKTPHFKQWPVHCVAGTPGADYVAGLVFPEELLIRPLFTPCLTEFFKGTDETDGYSGVEARMQDTSPGTMYLGPTAKPRPLGQTLLEWLDRQDTKAVFVCGLATDYCVKATVLDLLRNKHKVYVLADAIAAVSEATGQTARGEMLDAGAIWATIDDVPVIMAALRPAWGTGLYALPGSRA